MRTFRVRLFLTDSYWTDTFVFAENWFVAQNIAMGQSPVGRAIILGESN